MKSERTHANLRKLLNESLINPKAPTGITRIIMETGGIVYYMQRACELIQECNMAYDDKKAKLAITLMGLARLFKNYTE